MVARESSRRRRVIALLNAIADLQEGDLLAVLDLDGFTPMVEFGEKDRFEYKNGKIVVTPGWPPAPKSLKHRARTGKDLARILEWQLISTLGFGEARLTSYQKLRRGKDLGGRVFE